MHEVHKGTHMCASGLCEFWVTESSLGRISALGVDGGTLGPLFDVLGRLTLHLWFRRPG